MCLNVRERPQHHSVITKKRLHPPDRLRIVEIQFEVVSLFNNAWYGQERFKLGRTATWTTSRTATAVRCRERLMQIEVNYVNAHIAGSRDPHQGIHVGTVHIDEPTRLMNDLANLLNVFFEQTQCVWVSQH